MFDEAHNIMETITSMNSVSITSLQLTQAEIYLSQYLDKYGGRLAPKNHKSLKEVLNIINLLSKFLASYQ